MNILERELLLAHIRELVKRMEALETRIAVLELQTAQPLRLPYTEPQWPKSGEIIWTTGCTCGTSAVCPIHGPVPTITGNDYFVQHKAGFTTSGG